ncbi:F-box protein SKIP19 [Morella rubra]|uniref:F-box protein SKIP19 n=1 Tax=Morella rubra TaxID=262757 RepID=A0A6A1WC42_9ROSI|nr:F-box protein SKIP19 [Morella rubra]KAB1222795.1 F-box protein SKIP19 [Morella rubra]
MDPSPAHPPGDLLNWLELPRDVTASILLKLGAIEILTSAQKVCSLWRNICKDPSMWRAVDMRNLGDFDINIDYDLEKMCQHAVDRSGGELVDINIEHFGTDELLKYITESSSKLRRLRLVSCYSISDKGLSEAAGKLPLLEELDISYCSLSKESLEAVGRCCPLLKSLKFNNHGYRRPRIECDEDALAIAESMPELRHLQLFGNKLTNDGLLAVLGGCPKIESLDLRHCFNVTLTGDLGRRCADSIKHLRSPCDSTSDYEFDTEIHDSVSFDEDSASEFSDIDYFSDDDWYYELSGDSDSSDFDMYENGDFFDLSDHGEFIFD